MICSDFLEYWRGGPKGPGHIAIGFDLCPISGVLTDQTVIVVKEIGSDTANLFPKPAAEWVIAVLGNYTAVSVLNSNQSVGFIIKVIDGLRFITLANRIAVQV